MPDISLWPACDHKCTMCSNQKDYKYTIKDYTFNKIKERIDKFIAGDSKQFFRFSDMTEDWTITGGEPTLNPEYFKILTYIREKFPDSKIVQLTNGNSFSDEDFAKKISNISNYHIVFPIHGYNKETHEAIVRVNGSFEKLLKGIQNVIKYKKYNNQTLEIRIIIQGQNYKNLNKIYNLLYKYFGPHIDRIVTIMMEHEGQAIDNIDLTKVNYFQVMENNEKVFLEYGEKFGSDRFRLYHFPLCVIKDSKLWKYMWRTLPPDEIQYLDKCNKCELKEYCMGIHENYCSFNGEEEIKIFKKDDIKGLKIIDNNENFKFKPIKDVKIKNGAGKKTVIFTGYGCNNNCRFCVDFNKKNLERTTKEIIKEIVTAKKNKSDIIELIGGEATIRPDFFKIMSIIKALNFSHVYIVTNGMKFDDTDFCKKLYNMNVIDNIVFSIHGHNFILHDTLTQTPGSFEKLLKGIKNLQDLGFNKKNIATNTTIEKGNYEKLEDIGKKIKEIGCLGSSEFIFADPNEGGVKNDFDKLMPKISKAAPFMRKILDWGNKNNMIFRVRYVPLCYFEKYLDNNISELKEIEIYESVVHSAPDFYNNDVVEGRKNSGRVKTKKCIGCKLYDRCEGIWKNYYDKLGDDELNILK